MFVGYIILSAQVVGPTPMTRHDTSHIRNILSLFLLKNNTYLRPQYQGLGVRVDTSYILGWEVCYTPNLWC